MPIRVQVVGHGLVEFPDGTPQEEMQKALEGLRVPSTSTPASLAPQGVRVSGDSFGDKVKNAATLIGTALPTAGGIVGGMVGGTPGAALGGAAGEGYRQLAEHVTELPGAVVDVSRNVLSHPVETAKGFVQGANSGAVNAAEQGAGQAAGQLAGEGIAKGGSVMAKWLMNRATTRVSAALMRDFPELSDTLIDNALTVSKGGYGQARALLMGAKAKATQALATADAAGATLPIRLNPDLADSLKTALLEKAVKSGQVPGAQPGQALDVASARLPGPMRKLFSQIDAAAGQRAGMHSAAVPGQAFELTPSQADLLKTQLQRESRALYLNRTAPNGPRAMGMDATERAEYATQLNTAIDALASGYKAANAEAQPLLGAVRGLKQAIRPNGNLYQAMVRPAVGAALGGAAGTHEGGTPGGMAGAIAGAALTSPAGMSREAIVLSHPVMQGVLKALPAPLAQGLVDLLASSGWSGPATPAPEK